MNQRLIREWESALLQKVDLAVVSSDALVEKKSKVVKTELLTHGCDIHHFKMEPVDKIPAGKFVVCYFGLFDERSNQKLLKRIARELPDIEIRITGNVVVDVSELKKLPNIHFAGSVAYEDLPKHIHDVDAFILPYVCDELAENINPIKMKEYMATGKPTVSTALPEVRKFSEFIHVAHTEDEFVEFVAKIKSGKLTHNQDAAWERLQTETWETKATKFIDFIEGYRTRYLSVVQGGAL